MTEHCVVCNAEIPEGRQVCPKCEEGTLQDSGGREQFDTGAVRDIQTNKGRRDLLPLDVIAGHLRLRDMSSTSQLILNDIERFKNAGTVEFLYEAIDNFCIARYSGDCTEMYLELAQHFSAGAAKYGDNNWQKGIPTRYYIASATGHYLKWLRGDTDEPHDRAFIWNLVCCIWTCIHKPELNDYREEK